MKKLIALLMLLIPVSFAQDEAIIMANMYFMSETLCTSPLSSEEEKSTACEAKKKIEDSLEGLSSGTFDVALIYFQGQSEAGKDFKLSKYWMEKSSELGNVEAQKLLSMFYFMGTGVRQDVDKGVFWAEKASAQGDQDVNMILGSLYYEGELVKQDLEKAKLYYGKMCDAGEQVGCDFYKKANEEYLRQKNK